MSKKEIINPHYKLLKPVQLLYHVTNRHETFHWTLTFIFFICSCSVHSQKGLNPNINSPSFPRITDNHIPVITGDTNTINYLLNKLKHLNQQGRFLCIDSARSVAHSAISLSKYLNYSKGLQRLLETLGWSFYVTHQLDSACYYEKLALAHAKQHNEHQRTPLINFRIGLTFFSNFQNDSAIHYFTESMDAALRYHDNTFYQASGTQVARTYIVQEQYTLAAKQIFELIHEAESRKDTSSLLYNYYYLGILYLSLNLKEKGLELARVSQRLSRHIHDTMLLWSVNNLACNAYSENEMYDSVMYYSRIGIPFYQKINMVPWYFHFIGDVYLEKGKLDSAQYYYNLLEKEALASNNPIGGEFYLSMGKLKLKQGDFKKSLYYFKLAEEDTEIHDPSLKRQVCKSLAEYYEHIQDYSSALEYSKKDHLLQDSILSAQNMFIISAAFATYDSAKLATKIEYLAKENKLQNALAQKQRQQKNMVYASAALLVILFGFGLHRYRKYQNLKTKQSLSNERLRFSRDLHDEVGATLSGIAMYSHLAKEQIHSASVTEVKASLNIIQESSGEMVGKLSDMVWLINPTHDTLADMAERIAEYARKMALAKEMRVALDLPSTLSDIHLSMEVRQNMYLLCKEAINNAVKYSQGSQLSVRFIHTLNSLTLSISDDGIGFEIHTVKLGNGILNIKKRAQEIGAKIELDSSPGKGTKIQMLYRLST